MTLTEVLVAMLVLAIVVFGALSFRYYTSKELFQADSRMERARLALVLLESWKGMGGNLLYDPTEDVGTLLWRPSEGPATPAGLHHLGSYMTRTDTGEYYATLSYLNETADEPALLHVAVTWMPAELGWHSAESRSATALTTYANARGL